MFHSFGSDNHSGIHPLILEAIAAANTGHVPAYGDDLFTEKAKKKVCQALGAPGADVYFMFNGTGANVLALRTLTRPFNAVICASTAHINENECGAPDAHTGCKLLAIPTPDGKLTPELCEPYLHSFGNQHANQPRIISITQPSEMGTMYTLSEIAALSRLAHDKGIYLHIDGTRLANAVAALGCTPKQMLVDTGVDVLSFGGTKNGMMLGEAVVFFNPELSADAKYQRKQLMQLSSKMRFVSAQFDAYLTDGLWIANAAHANAMASYLHEKLQEVAGVRILQKVEANSVFVAIPREAVTKLKAEGYYFNVKDGDQCQVRWVCSFDTTQDDVDALISSLKRIFQ